MQVSMEICIVPMGVGVSVSPYIAACEKVFTESGINPELHAYGTNVEGEWETVMAALKRCHEVVHEMGAPRIFTTLKMGTRTDRAQTNQDKIDSVRDKLNS